MYQPTGEQADADRKAAYERGVPHGYVAPGDKYAGLPTITIKVVSELVSRVGRGGVGGCSGNLHPTISTMVIIACTHTQNARPCMKHEESEYGEHVDAAGKHSGGAFEVTVSPKMRIEELRKIIRVRQTRS
jgi:hypothetical protein